MKDNQAKYPQLRFKGFTDPWVQRQVGDFLTESRIPGSNGAISKKLTVKLWGKGVIPKETVTDGSEATKYYVRKAGQFMYGKLDFLHAAFGIVPENLDGYESTLDSPAFDIANLNSTFLMDTVMRKSFYLYQGNIANGSRKAKRIHVDTFSDMPIDVPTLDEQDKIGYFFDQLDNLIAANQRKLDLLKEQKKGYLQKMFPKNGAKVPELRFAGFADAWEQRKVSELADRYDNLRVPITASERVAGETPYYGANGIQDYVEGFTHNGEFVLVAEDGANDLQNYPVQYVDGKVWVNNHAHVLQAKEERVDNKFLTNALKHTNIEPYLVGGGRAKLNADVMMKINFKVPTLPEQVQIGKFFDNLDHLITLHQRKLEKLQELKKGYLQKMFC
ncbi:restriction endonuclease subunit S [Lacticaseibacillus paracasei]|uniref:restriction endonuclease subunit S n=1 Tax=Lacticaseibacillus paracasei TaxID=1597 RepID=UPI001F506AEA|nr:restriction endonuclease subunit S [Lacticaseibacillus paracasei]MCI0375802.1 restriction endonuclease subunit S [Lacticaseibacillus paracasei]MCP9305771.1 restriction endonuclease subunit S [Lacticaseibacillus paracasei]